MLSSLKQDRRIVSSAFTLVELLIVIVIIAILAAITIISYNGISSRAKSSALESSLSSAGKKLATYALQNSNTLPSDTTAFLSTTNLNNNGPTTYQYTVNTSTTPNLYCITANQDSNTITYHIAGNADGTVNKVIQGPCVGTGTGTSATHQGTAPTTLADGSSCPTGYIVIPGNSTYNQDSFCVMKYEAKNDGSGNAVSTAVNTPWVNINQIDAKTKSTAAGGHIITEAEWMTIAANVVSVPGNWSTGTVGSVSGYIYSGHNDSAPASALAASTDDTNGYYGETNTGGNQKRTLTLTNGNVIWDLAGNVWEWTDQTITGNQPGLSSDTGGAWREWNGGFTRGDLGQLSMPSSASLAISNRGSGAGIGQLWSNPTDSSARAFSRGGNWNNSSHAGVVALYLGYSPAGTAADFGFRVAR